MSRWPGWLLRLAVLALIAGATGTPATTSAQRTTADAEQPLPTARTREATAVAVDHTVQPGESFWRIAESVVGSSDPAIVGPYWLQLMAANRDRLVRPGDPDLILPGQVLTLPDTGEPPDQPSAPPPPDDGSSDDDDGGGGDNGGDDGGGGGDGGDDNGDDNGGDDDGDDGGGGGEGGGTLPPGDDTLPLTVVSYNIRGGIRDEPVTGGEFNRYFRVNPEDLAFTADVAAAIASEEPDIVLLQEVCGTQAALILRSLEDQGYPMEAAVLPSERVGRPDDPEGLCPEDPENPEGPEGPDQDLTGQAILARTEGVQIDAPSSATHGGLFHGYGAEFDELNGLRVCSVHDNPYANPGADYFALAQEFAFWAREAPLLVGGDFNAEPTSPEMEGFYSTAVGGIGVLYEADMCEASGGDCSVPQRDGEKTSGPPPEAISKLDYIFVDEEAFDSVVDGQTWAPQCPGDDPRRDQCSDHWMLVGHVNMIVDEDLDEL